MDNAKNRQTFGDMKAGLTQGARPKMTIAPRASIVYLVRALEYGAAKYARGNYHGPAPAALGADAPVLRVLGYLDALGRHSSRISDAVNRALGTGSDPAAAFAGALDTEASGNFPASCLHDLAHAMACVALAISCAVDDGLLPADPGQPWADGAKEAGLPQKDDPASELRRIAEAAASRTAAPIRGPGDPGYRYAVPAGPGPRVYRTEDVLLDSAEAGLATAARARLEDEGVLPPPQGGPAGVRW